MSIPSVPSRHSSSLLPKSHAPLTIMSSALSPYLSCSHENEQDRIVGCRGKRKIRKKNDSSSHQEQGVGGRSGSFWTGHVLP